MAIMFVFGAHAFVWGTTSNTVRMRAVPTELRGRVGSLYAIGVFGGTLAGQAVGGFIAQIRGVTPRSGSRSWARPSCWQSSGHS
jgi:hypothetical protein